MKLKPAIMRLFRRPRRIDHHPMYVAIVFATGTWSGSLLLFGPTENSVISELSIGTQYFLSTLICMGAFVAQFGIFINTRFIVIKRLKRLDVRDAYAFGITGIPSMAIGLEVYFWATVHGAMTPFTSALGASIAFAIPIGSLWNLMMFLVRRWEIEDYISMRRKEIGDDLRSCD